MATVMEREFDDAVKAGTIDSYFIEGRTTSGQSYSHISGTRILLDGSTIAASSTDLFRIASATKLLATIAALQCVERGQLSLTEDLSPQLGAMGEMPVITGTDESGFPTLGPRTKPITLAHLLTHSAGFTYYFMSPTVMAWRAKNPPPDPARDVPTRMTYPLSYQPGEGWYYGVGMDWAGWLVEQNTGLKLDEYIRTHILAPVGADPNDLSFYPVVEGLGDRLVDLNPKDPEGYGMAAVGGAKAFGEMKGNACFGGHGANGTSRAYIAVLQSLVNNDEKLLSKAMREKMFSPQLEPGAQKAFDEHLAGPLGEHFGNGTAGKGRSMGLGGLLVGEDGDGGMSKGTLLWGGGHNTAWLMDPKKGVAAFASPQLVLPTPSTETATKLKSSFRKEIYNALGV